MNSYKNPLKSAILVKKCSSISHLIRNLELGKLWIALAEIEKDLGLDITDEQIAQLKEHSENIDFEKQHTTKKVSS